MHALTHRGIAAWVAIMLVVGLAVVIVARAPSASACNPNVDPNCVGVGAGSPGGPGGSGGGGTSHSGGHGPGQPDPCAALSSGYARQLCEGGIATRQSEICQELYTQYYASSTTAQLNAILAASGCPGIAAGAAPPSPAQLAQQAAASFELPNPTGDRSPSPSLLYEGFPFTYVNLPTFFWTDPGTWKAFTATARAGGNWATVTARPVSLTFDPGDGSSPVPCAGPGRPWEASDGNGPPTRGACAYRYVKATGPGYDHPVTATQTITWQLTWTGSGNTSGTLTSKSTSTSGQLNVLQVQVVNR